MKNNNITPIAKSSHATEQNSNLGSANTSFDELYLKKDYKAAANYLLQHKQQFNSGIFHYNLGTVLSKTNDYAAARFHLEKALKDGYLNSSSLNNLNYVKLQLQVDDLSNSTSVPDQIINSSLSIPSAAFTSISLILVLMSIILIKSKKIIHVSKMIILLILSLTPILFSQLYIERINTAIALKNISVYEGPSKIFSEKGLIKAGSKIVLGDYKDGWFYVKFPISLSGWINKDQLGLY